MEREVREFLAGPWLEIASGRMRKRVALKLVKHLRERPLDYREIEKTAIAVELVEELVGEIRTLLSGDTNDERE